MQIKNLLGTIYLSLNDGDIFYQKKYIDDIEEKEGVIYEAGGF